MSIYQEAIAPPKTGSTEERERVLEQLERLFATHHFRNSKRYPALLRFIVLETLEGRGEFLKERLLGVRVFDRPADYDTAADPVVRVTIAEIRKRIAQYYHDEGHESELRIDLLPGSYTPEFRLPSALSTVDLLDSLVEKETPVPVQSLSSATDLEAVALPPAANAGKRPTRRRRALFAVLASALAALSIGGLGLIRWLRPSALDQFWGPMMGSGNPVLFCLPTDVGKVKGPAEDFDRPVAAVRGGSSTTPSFLSHETLGENVVLSDVLATLGIANFLAVHHQRSRVKLNKYTDLQDLRQGPAVLIGGLDNQWSMRALAPLRFGFAGSDNQTFWISDRKNPANREWAVDLTRPIVEVTFDYAIVTRLHNQQTGEMEVIVAGIGMSGTAAAGEFVADETMLRNLRQKIGPSFKDRDFEVVLSTEVANGIAGSPKILEVEVF